MAAKKRPQRKARKTSSAQTRRTTQAQVPPSDQTEVQRSAEAEVLTRSATAASPPEPTAGPTTPDVALPQATEADDPLPPESEFPRSTDNPHAIELKVPPPIHGEPKAPKLSALEAAARVLAETGQALSCPELIATMAAKGYWSSPKGRTPQATLYAAMLREINGQGAQ